MLYVFVNAVASPCVDPAADTVPVILNVEEPPTVNAPVVVTLVTLTVVPEIVPKAALFPDSYLLVLILV